MPALLLACVFAGSALLFLVEPMIARALLPGFGGSAAVWTTSLVFFQGLLLLGYAWSHFSVRRLGTRRQMPLQALVVLLPLAALPLLPRGEAPPGQWPVPALLAALAVSAGPAFFALSTNSTLVQHWAARAGREPWGLYAAGNAGSLAALVAYPLLVEPRLGLRAQAAAWSVGYGVFAALVLAVMLATRRRLGPAAEAAAPAGEPPGAARVARWVLRPLAASALLQSVTLVMTNQVASMPLLWTAPLAIYLATWIVAFLPRMPYPRAILAFVALAGVAASLALATRLAYTAEVALPVLFVTLAAGAWVCHADLARDRPPAAQLTGFYLWTSLGGFLGAALGSVLAPLAFDSLAEFPLSLALAAWMVALGPDGGASLRRALGTRPVRARVAVAAGLLLFAAAMSHIHPQAGWHHVAVLLVGLAVVWRAPAQAPVAATLAAVLLVSGTLRGDWDLLERRRSFYGELRVLDMGDWRMLAHGTTTHGVQLVDPPARVPGAYYHPSGPLGALVQAQPPGARLGLVGLGAGALAALTRPGQHATFFELDPEIEPLARRHFTFLRQARAQVEVVVGDARRTLARVAPGSLDLLVLDAFSGDAVPVHLLTTEALSLCLERLRPQGILALHVSNRYFDLAPVVRGAATALGLRAAVREFRADVPAQARGLLDSTVVALARTSAAVAALPGPGWEPLDGPGPVWTDDRSSLLEVLAWP